MAKRPRARWEADSDGSACDWSWSLEIRDWASLANGPDVLSAFNASMAWFWMRPARFSRQERLTMRSASIDSIGLTGASSSSIRSL